MYLVEQQLTVSHDFKPKLPSSQLKTIRLHAWEVGNGIIGMAGLQPKLVLHMYVHIRLYKRINRFSGLDALIS